MRTSWLIWALVVLVIVLGVWWLLAQNAPAPAPTTQSGQTSTATMPSTSEQSSSTTSSVTENLAVGLNSKPSLGQYLIAYNGMTVYIFTRDKVGTTTCYAQCAAKWPPYTVPAGSTLNLQAGISGAVGTIIRADGTTQVTYKGMPLYFYYLDKFPSDTKGEGVLGTWFIVKP